MSISSIVGGWFANCCACCYTPNTVEKEPEHQPPSADPEVHHRELSEVDPAAVHSSTASIAVSSTAPSTATGSVEMSQAVAPSEVDDGAEPPSMEEAAEEEDAHHTTPVATPPPGLTWTEAAAPDSDEEDDGFRVVGTGKGGTESKKKMD